MNTSPTNNSNPVTNQSTSQKVPEPEGKSLSPLETVVDENPIPQLSLERKARPVFDHERLVGSMYGKMVADALGVQFENWGPNKIASWTRGSIHPGLLWGKGAVSDDTELTAATVRAVVNSNYDATTFKSLFAREVRNWVACGPTTIGGATLYAGSRLMVGISRDPDHGGRAGNGSAMRSAPLGIIFGDDLAEMFKFVDASSRVTHTHPRAIAGALAVALAAHMSANRETLSADDFMGEVTPALALTEDTKLLPLLQKVVDSVNGNQSTKEFVNSIGLAKGVSGYILHTVPAAIHAWLSNPTDYRKAVTDMILCGGDTDTTAAIVGALVGARVKLEGIPAEWIAGIRDIGAGPSYMAKLCAAVKSNYDGDTTVKIPTVGAMSSMYKNAIFFAADTLNQFWRVFPPYS